MKHGVGKARGTDFRLTVCRPPHVIVSEARNFAVYSEKFIVVPPRQIGIVSVDGERALLKALALYLSSDFASLSPVPYPTQFGVQRASCNSRMPPPNPHPSVEAYACG